MLCLFSREKKKTTVLERATHTRSVLVDAVFSLDTVCRDMFDTVLKLLKKDHTTNIDQVVNIFERFETLVQNKFETLFRCLPQNCNDDLALPTSVISNTTVDDKDKHVIVSKKKDSDAKYDNISWSTVVKGTLQDQLKYIPVDKSLLNKSGQGCLFFPNDQAQDEAKTVLEPLFDLTTDSRPKKIMHKIKVFDVGTEVYNDKTELKQAIIEKNPDVKDLIDNNNDLDVIVINKLLNFAILKVTPMIRRLLIKRGRLFLGMHSIKVRDHFQPLQCYACQQYGHKLGSQ